MSKQNNPSWILETIISWHIDLYGVGSQFIVTSYYIPYAIYYEKSTYSSFKVFVNAITALICASYTVQLECYNLYQNVFTGQYHNNKHSILIFPYTIYILS